MALCCKKTLAALTAALMLAAPAWAETVLKVVPHADLKVLDPVWTTAFVTRHHGYMIYENGSFLWKDLDGGVVQEYRLPQQRDA